MEHAINRVENWNIEAGQIAADDVSVYGIERFGRFVDDQDAVDLSLDLIEEEVAELAAALADHDPVETLDAICDILFTTFGLAAKAGMADVVAPAFDEVCHSNDSKFLGFREVLPSGKMGKGSKYFEPDLDSVLRLEGFFGTVTDD